MKKILKESWELFCLDWRRVFQNKLTLVLVLALMILPSLYAWFNIAALWDPYSNTADLKIAVYSDDKTVDVLSKEINIGDKIITNLKTNDSIDWQFVDSKRELDEGVKKGKYYGGIYLPADFSKDLISFTKGEIVKPEIEYSVNQKINAIAPKITDKGAKGIKETISEEFINTVSESLMTTFNTLGYELDSHSVSIENIANKILTINDNLTTIDGYTQDIIALNKKMPTYKEKLDKAHEFTAYLPEVNKLADKLVALNQAMPQIQKDGQLLLTVQSKIPEIQQAGKQVAMIDQDFDDLTALFDQVIDEGTKGLSILADVQRVLPDVSQLATDANTLIPEVSASIEEVQKALPAISQGLGSSLEIIQLIAGDIAQTTNSLADFLANHELTPAEKEQIQGRLTKLNASLTSLNQLTTGTIKTLTQLQELAGNQAFAGTIQTLQNVQAAIPGVQAQIVALSADMGQFSTAQIQASLRQISQASATIVTSINQLDLAGFTSQVATVLAQVQQVLADAGKITNQVVDTNLIQKVDQLLTQTSGTLSKGLDFMRKYQAELPALKQEIHDANLLLNDNMTTLIGAINTGAGLYQNELPQVAEKLNKASNFAQNELPGLEQELQKTLGMMDQKFPKVENALTSGTELIEQDWPKVREGIQKAATLIRKGEHEVDLGALIKILKYDAKSESDFLANPVEINQTDVYPVPNNGSASAPFYTALCLWVGSVLFSSIASTEMHFDKEDKKRYGKRSQFMARLGTFLVVGFFQALIVSVGNLALLGIYSVNPVWFVLFSLLVGLVFMALVYTLVALLGNIGKGIAVILLVLSISAGGGNYPIELSGPFFQLIHPYIPFTYAVNLLREPVGGIYWPNTVLPLVVLSLVGVIFILVGLYIYPYAKPLLKKMNQKLQKGHLLH